LVAIAGVIGLVTSLTVQAMVGATCHVDVVPRETRPNIVVIAFDDLEVSLAGALPEWRSLEQRGINFDHAVVTTPLCCPSRASILTGRYAHNHGVITNAIPDGGHKRALEMGIERCTVAVWLQQAGYMTALMGKYLNGYGFQTPASDVPAGWDRWAALWKETGTAPSTYLLNVDGTVTRPTQYQTDELTERALEFMSGAEAAGSPFFLYLTPTPPHRPWIPPAHYVSADAGGYPIPERYRMMLAGMDLVQRVMQAAPEDTYFVITSDNGYHLLPIPGKAEPRYVDVHVPFVVVGPDVPTETRDELVANIDLAPTIAAWAGVKAPAEVDGASFLPLITGQGADWRQEITVEMVGEWSAILTHTEMRIDRVVGPDDVVDLR
jgi:N-acetylglucosamine-6-sulfatase